MKVAALPEIAVEVSMPPVRPPKPARRFRLELRLEADDRERLAAALEQIAFEVRTDQLTQGCTGSPCWGATYSLSEDPDQTHERYFGQVAEWLKESGDGSQDGGHLADVPAFDAVGP